MANVLFILFLLLAPFFFKVALVTLITHIALPLGVILTLYLLFKWA